MILGTGLGLSYPALPSSAPQPSQGLFVCLFLFASASLFSPYPAPPPSSPLWDFRGAARDQHGCPVASTGQGG